jgi:hypothetical protein
MKPEKKIVKQLKGSSKDSELAKPSLKKPVLRPLWITTPTKSNKKIPQCGQEMNA